MIENTLAFGVEELSTLGQKVNEPNYVKGFEFKMTSD